MEKRMFHVGQVMSVVYMTILNPEELDGIVEVLNFMTKDNIHRHQIPRALTECMPHLLVQFPVLGSPRVNYAVDEFKEMLKTPNGQSRPRSLVIGWLSKLTSGQYGVKVDEFLEVEALPEHVHEFIDPHSELAQKIHSNRIITL